MLAAPLYWTSTGSGYYEGKLGSDMDAMMQAAGISKEYGSSTHALRHKGMQNSQLLLKEMEKASRQLDPSGGGHDDNYAFCNYPSIKDSAAIAGHLDGHVRPYRTGPWASKIPKYKPLYDALNRISDKAFAVAPVLAGPRRRQGIQMFLDANGMLPDTLLQDLVAAMRVSDLEGAFLLQRTEDFPFLKQGDKECCSPTVDLFKHVIYH